MALQGTNNPFGHPDPLVDRMIGSAFDTVKLVAHHLGLINAVGRALQPTEGQEATDAMLTQRIFTVDGTLGDIGEETRYDIPDQVVIDSIISITARVKIGNNAYVFNDNRFYDTSLEDGQLVILMRNDAPSDFANAVVRWFVICGA